MNKGVSKFGAVYLCLFMTVFVCFCAGSEIEVTLISPEPRISSGDSRVELEGLVSDLTVKEFRIIVNSQSDRFIAVDKGYFKGIVDLDQRENKIMIFGANQQRKQFRAEFTVVNEVFREKTEDQKIAPFLEVQGLTPDKFQILSTLQYLNLELLATDNRGEIVQVGYVFNGEKPVYLRLNDSSRARLNLPKDLSRLSQSLHVFALDNDGNRSSLNFHFRVDHLDCDLLFTPQVGIFGVTPIVLSSRVTGGTEPVKKKFSIRASGDIEILSKESQESDVLLQPEVNFGKTVFYAQLDLVDKNGIEGRCTSKERGLLYPQEFPRQFHVLSARLETIKQSLSFQMEPPIQKGEVSVLLKKNDPLQGMSQEEWKVLGSISLNSSTPRTNWESSLTQRVPVGPYLMKLSFASGTQSQMSFTQTTQVLVTRSMHDSVDLLQGILREELGNR
ncbi:MAG: hypothetical protein H3C47_04845 [Candidatus Cloacimonetes bacterium]|nr:hypothetical protein [Candidatus Cloacimonadota bacterium]